MSSMMFNLRIGQDPTRTLDVRRAFTADVTRRFRSIKAKIWDAVVTKDVFGLKRERNPFVQLAESGLPRRAFAFRTDPQKVEGFMDWLAEQVDEGIFELQPGAPRRAVGSVEWANTYIDTSYKRGMKRGADELRKSGVTPSRFPVEETGFEIDIRFNQPIHADKVGLIHTRTYTDLRGITNTMESEIADELARGLAEGRGPIDVARKLVNRVEKSGGTLAIVDEQGTVRMRAIQRARILARTETIRAHHVATINTYREAGLEGVTVLAEWATAGDDRVCEACQGLEGKVFSLDAIENLIPFHPQCRCVALPYLGKVGGEGWREIESGVWEPPSGFDAQKISKAVGKTVPKPGRTRTPTRTKTTRAPSAKAQRKVVKQAKAPMKKEVDSELKKIREIEKRIADLDKQTAAIKKELARQDRIASKFGTGSEEYSRAIGRARRKAVRAGVAS